VTKLVVDGASLRCDQGTSSATLKVVAGRSTDNDNRAATVDDYVPMTNIGSFGMCQTQSNPQVAAATSAAQGVLTPQPCVPVVTSAWSPGAAHLTLDGVKALSSDSTCSCQWTGSISISSPASDVDLE
jgi:uncharacterized protein DUF4280